MGILGLKSSWQGKLLEFEDFLKYFAPNSGKNCPKAEIFLARKSLISDIPGIPGR
jgi:hypothetical protein